MPFVRRKGGQVLVVHSARREGRVRQEVLARFASPEALSTVLHAWGAWTDAMQWRHEGLSWDFEALRERLAAELEGWAEKSRGAATRRRLKLARTIRALRDDLAVLSAADPSDAATIEESRPALFALAGTIERLLRAPSGPAHATTAEEQRILEEKKGTDMEMLEAGIDEANDLFHEGMEHWWVGDVTLACRLYRKAVKLDPSHGDALTHLGIAAYERGRLKQAEALYRAAIEAEEPKLERDGDEVHWGFIENRPYLRALGNLALCHRRRRHWEDALEIHLRMLRLNPNDNQGVRALVGEELHRVGRLEEAIAAHERAQEFPACNFGLALALLAAGRATDAALPLLRGMVANRYVAPMLLGEPWGRLECSHMTSLAEPEEANAYVEDVGDLWRNTDSSAGFLRSWWAAAPVRAWRQRLDELLLELDGLAPGDRRSRLVHERFAEMDDEWLAELVGEVRALS